jgi:hypothetical protein
MNLEIHTRETGNFTNTWRLNNKLPNNQQAEEEHRWKKTQPPTAQGIEKQSSREFSCQCLHFKKK